jgi:hypothetical protein
MERVSSRFDEKEPEISAYEVIITVACNAKLKSYSFIIDSFTVHPPAIAAFLAFRVGQNPLGSQAILADSAVSCATNSCQGKLKSGARSRGHLFRHLVG